VLLGVLLDILLNLLELLFLLHYVSVKKIQSLCRVSVIDVET
jgi:hypothetical protein